MPSKYYQNIMKQTACLVYNTVKVAASVFIQFDEPHPVLFLAIKKFLIRSFLAKA